MNRVVAAWERFWFEPQETSSLAVLRICFGLVALAWTIALAPDLSAFFSRTGLVASQPHAGGVWGVLGVFPGRLAVMVMFAVLVVACVCLTVGYRTRLAALLVFVGVLSFERRNPYVFNTGDGLIRLIALFLILTPAGASLSVDRWRKARDRFWEFPACAPWGLRLMQLQLSILYIASVVDKLEGTTWVHGSAISYALRISDLERLPLPLVLTHSALVSGLLTYGALATELGIGVLVWNRRLRPWVLAVGVVMHVTIEWSIRVGFFGLAILTLYLAFLDPTWCSARLRHLQRRLSRRGASRPAALAARPQP
jgi:hypothetical protein